MATSETDKVVPFSMWRRRYNGEGVLIVLEVVPVSSEQDKKWGGNVRYQTKGSVGRHGWATAQRIVEWGVYLGLAHDFSDRHLQPKGMRACGTCKDLWPLEAQVPGICTPSTDERPAQIVLEEKIAALMSRG